MILPEYELSNAERKRRDDEIWNAAIEAAARRADAKLTLAVEFRLAQVVRDAIRALKRPVS